ncbi:hypothetical protein HX13_14035 [Chryseobacterium sp. P1-3]|uniref:hypothetical protein n=1 Tax=Chryseobacterium sp. (strain P1-3) TaxID=1517683 RepID=UPI0004E611B6|nr:hypothetical protein [Chryseobacterium sp. P1-3]KFF74244.1 hypothetical protein HX13_14035 [Chryseobacterium sp. P1-3]
MKDGNCFPETVSILKKELTIVKASDELGIGNIDLMYDFSITNRNLGITIPVNRIKKMRIKKEG